MSGETRYPTEYESDRIVPRFENPKQRFGNLKPNLALVPAATMIYLALGHECGVAKYGAYNWRETKVETMTYIAAAMRHLVEWVDGQEKAADSGIPHLAHALTSLSVLVDAIETGNAVDNRPAKGKGSVMIQVIENERRRAGEIAAEVLFEEAHRNGRHERPGRRADHDDPALGRLLYS